MGPTNFNLYFKHNQTNIYYSLAAPQFLPYYQTVSSYSVTKEKKREVGLKIANKPGAYGVYLGQAWSPDA